MGRGRLKANEAVEFYWTSEAEGVLELLSPGVLLDPSKFELGFPAFTFPGIAPLCLASGNSFYFSP